MRNDSAVIMIPPGQWPRELRGPGEDKANPAFWNHKEPIPESPVRVLAVFFHGTGQGKELISGSVRRFLEVARVIPDAGVDLTTVEFSPPLVSREVGRVQPIGIPRAKEPTSLRRLVNLIRLGVYCSVFGRRGGSEVIYAPDRTEDQLIPALFASTMLRKPLLVVIHSVHIEEVKVPIRRLFMSQLRSGRKLKKALARTGIEVLLRLGYRRATAFVAVSGTTAREVSKAYPPRTTVVSGNAVSDDWFELPEAAKTQDCCFLGTVSPEKRQDLLIRTMKIVLKSRPGAKLALVGGAKADYLETCKALVRELDIEKSVVFTGFVDDANARRWMNTSRVFVSASTWEGFGLSVLEAMAAGMPCIISDIPALREVFGGAAVLVDSSDPQVWADVLTGLLGDQERMERLSFQGKECARRYRWVDVGRREADLIHALAKRRVSVAGDQLRT